MGSHKVLGSMSKNLNSQNGINGDRFVLHISQNVVKILATIHVAIPSQLSAWLGRWSHLKTKSADVDV